MIKWLISLLFIPGVLFAEEQSEEFLMGSLTYHYFNFNNADSAFKNKVSSNGALIANPMASYKKVVFDGENEYYSFMFFGGENSIGEGMGGTAFSMGLGNREVRFGIIGGAYLQNIQKFADRGLTSFSVPVSDQLGLAPVVGWELSFNFDLSPSSYLTIYNVFTPILYTSALGIGWRL